MTLKIMDINNRSLILGIRERAARCLMADVVKLKRLIS